MAGEADKQETPAQWPAALKSPIAQILIPPILTIVGSLSAYFASASTTQTRAKEVAQQEAKAQAGTVENKAQAGYAVTREAYEDLKRQVAQLRAEVGALRRAVKTGSQKIPAAVPPPPPPATAPAMPANLDKALEQKPQESKP